MNKNQIPVGAETPAAATPTAAATGTSNTVERDIQNECAYASELLAIGRSYATRGGIEAAKKVIKGGDGGAQLRAAIMADIQVELVITTGEISMTDKEQRESSLLRTMSAAVTGRWDKTGLEHEVSEELERRHGRTTASFFVPTGLIARAYSKRNATSGGSAIENGFREDLFVRLLRNRLTIT